MITLDYLQKILKGELTEIGKVRDQIIESAGGYDGIVGLIQTKDISPMIVLENSEVGELSFLPGGFEKTSQSIWVMKKVNKDGDRQAVQKKCKLMMRDILAKMAKEAKEHDQEIGHPLKDWEWDRIPYGVRNAGANYTGYEFTLYFSEDTDLSYHGQE